MGISHRQQGNSQSVKYILDTLFVQAHPSLSGIVKRNCSCVFSLSNLLLFPVGELKLVKRGRFFSKRSAADTDGGCTHSQFCGNDDMGVLVCTGAAGSAVAGQDMLQQLLHHVFTDSVGILGHRRNMGLQQSCPLKVVESDNRQVFGTGNIIGINKSENGNNGFVICRKDGSRRIGPQQKGFQCAENLLVRRQVRHHIAGVETNVVFLQRRTITIDPLDIGFRVPVAAN